MLFPLVEAERAVSCTYQLQTKLGREGLTSVHEGQGLEEVKNLAVIRKPGCDAQILPSWEWQPRVWRKGWFSPGDGAAPGFILLPSL